MLKVIKTSASSSSCNQIEYSRFSAFLRAGPRGTVRFFPCSDEAQGAPVSLRSSKGSFFFSFFHAPPTLLSQEGLHARPRAPLVEAQVFG